MAIVCTIIYRISHPPHLVAFQEDELPSSFIHPIKEGEERKISKSYQVRYENLLLLAQKVREIFVTSGCFNQVLSRNTRYKIRLLEAEITAKLNDLKHCIVKRQYSHEKLIDFWNVLQMIDHDVDIMLWHVSKRFCVWAIPDEPPPITPKQFEDLLLRMQSRRNQS